MLDPFALSRIEDRLERIEDRIYETIRETWLDLERASHYSGLSIRTLRRAVKSGNLTHSKTTGKILFRREWIDGFLIYGKPRLKPKERRELERLVK